MNIREKIWSLRMRRASPSSSPPCWTGRAMRPCSPHRAGGALHALLPLPGLVILDLGLPDMDGWTFSASCAAGPACRWWWSPPVPRADKVTALDQGADDYLTKPFGTPSCWPGSAPPSATPAPPAATARSPKRAPTPWESWSSTTTSTRFWSGEKREAHPQRVPHRGPAGQHAGKVLTYDFIIRELWGPRAGGGNQILRVNMANIRRKIEGTPPSRNTSSLRWAWATVWPRGNRPPLRGKKFTAFPKLPQTLPTALGDFPAAPAGKILGDCRKKHLRPPYLV